MGMVTQLKKDLGPAAETTDIFAQFGQVCKNYWKNGNAIFSLKTFLCCCEE